MATGRCGLAISWAKTLISSGVRKTISSRRPLGTRTRSHGLALSAFASTASLSTSRSTFLALAAVPGAAPPSSMAAMNRRTSALVMDPTVRLAKTGSTWTLSDTSYCR